MLFGAPDMAAFAGHKKLEADPGTRWKYSSGTSMILSQVLRDVLGDDEYHQFPRRALFDALGMTRAVMEADARGTFVASSYMYATAREWARFGQLYLQDGVWMGKRILPEGWVAYARTPAPADPRSAYGAHLWLSTPAEYRGSDAVLPAHVFHAAGHEAQFVTIVPSHDVVIVRLGRTRYPSAWAHDRFVSAVLVALGH
jgi:CubicO group peptidase (beta-lactamase class C family)